MKITSSPKLIKENELFMFVGSFNMAGTQCKPNTFLLDWLLAPIKRLKIWQTPDIYVIGMQEIVNLDVKNILLSSNSNCVDNLDKVLKNNLDQIDE